MCVENWREHMMESITRNCVSAHIRTAGVFLTPVSLHANPEQSGLKILFKGVLAFYVGVTLPLVEDVRFGADGVGAPKPRLPA